MQHRQCKSLADVRALLEAEGWPHDSAYLEKRPGWYRCDAVENFCNILPGNIQLFRSKFSKML